MNFREQRIEIGGNQQVHLHQICLQTRFFRDRQTNYIVNDFQNLKKKYITMSASIPKSGMVNDDVCFYSYPLDTRHPNIAAVNPWDFFPQFILLKMVSLGLGTECRSFLLTQCF